MHLHLFKPSISSGPSPYTLLLFIITLIKSGHCCCAFSNDCIYIPLFPSMEISLQLVLTCKFRTILIRLEMGDYFFPVLRLPSKEGDFMANVSTTLSSAKIQGLFKQPAHSLYLLKTCLGGSSLKSHVITLHVIQQSSLSFANCFYMLSVSLPVWTALSLRLNPWPTWSQSPLGAPRTKVCCAELTGLPGQQPWAGHCRACGVVGELLESWGSWRHRLLGNEGNRCQLDLDWGQELPGLEARLGSPILTKALVPFAGYCRSCCVPGSAVKRNWCHEKTYTYLYNYSLLFFFYF